MAGVWFATFGKNIKDSDIDLLLSCKDVDLLEYTDNYYDLLSSLEDLFGRKVDFVVGRFPMNSYFTKSVNESKPSTYGGSTTTQFITKSPLRWPNTVHFSF